MERGWWSGGGGGTGGVGNTGGDRGGFIIFWVSLKDLSSQDLYKVVKMSSKH